MKALSSENVKPVVAFVDDEPELTDVYSTILSEDYEVLTFNHPEQLLSFLEGHNTCPFEVLVTDLKMPKMTGLQLIERAHQKGFQFPSLLLSGYIDNKNILPAIGIGALRMIEKPADISHIKLAIQELVAAQRTVQAEKK